jgi:hypothetical protein
MTYNPNSGFTFEDYLKFGAALGFVFLFIFGPRGLVARAYTADLVLHRRNEE